MFVSLNSVTATLHSTKCLYCNGVIVTFHCKLSYIKTGIFSQKNLSKVYLKDEQLTLDQSERDSKA